MTNEYYVYIHKRMDTGAVFYVGKGKGRRANIRSGRNNLWQKIASKHGFAAEIIASGLSEIDAFELEKKSIKLFDNLCNFTDGGDGVSGYRHTLATKESIRAAHKGKPQPRELVERRVELLRGQKRPPEFGLSIALRNSGRAATAETRLKMSESHMGRVMSEESIAKTVAWHTGSKRSEESKQRMSKASTVKRGVICVETGAVFESLEGAAAWLRENGKEKANRSGIGHCLAGLKIKSYGYRWVYCEPAKSES